MDSRSISILRNNFSPNLVPEISDPSSVVILNLTPGAGAVAFTTLEGVEDSKLSITLKQYNDYLRKYENSGI